MKKLKNKRNSLVHNVFLKLLKEDSQIVRTTDKEKDKILNDKFVSKIEDGIKQSNKCHKALLQLLNKKEF